MHSRVGQVSGFMLLVMLAGTQASGAQTPAGVQVRVATGGCSVRLTAAPDPQPREFSVRVNNTEVKTITLAAGRSEASVLLDGPLPSRDELTVHHGTMRYATTERLPAPAADDPACAQP